MKIARLKLVNFRSFKAETIDFQDIVVLIGENNAGKSNILKALDLFFSDTKTLSEEFFNDREKPIIIQVAFNQLSNAAKEQFAKYLLDDGETVIIKKEYHLVPEADMKLFAVMTGEKYGQEKKDSKKTADAIEILDKEQIAPFAIDGKTYFWKEKPFGWSAVATGYLPDFLYVPAVKDVGEEAKVTSTSRFGRLINAMLDKALQNADLIRINEEFTKLLSGSNENQDGRIEQIGEFERQLSEKLGKHMKGATLKLDISPPTIKDVFQKGTHILVNDGVTTPVEFRGHGMQRSVIFVIFQAYTEFLKKNQDKDSLKSLIFGFEEPELYLHPQMQRTMFSVLKEISKSDQVIFTTHSSFFVEMSNHRSIGIVVKRDLKEGSKVIQCQQEIFPETEERKQFQLLNEFDPERNEMFFGRKVILVEGDTEKVVLPLLASKFDNSYVFHENGITVVECGGKGFMPLFARVLNCFRVPYVAIYDKDGAEGANLNQKIENLVSASAGIGRSECFDPDFETICKNGGVQFVQERNKAFVAYKTFRDMDVQSVPERLKQLVESIFKE